MNSRSMHMIAVTASIGVLLMTASIVQAHPSRCSSCHVPHKAATDGDASGASYGVPLWNPSWGGNGKTPPIAVPSFTPYTSKTFDALGASIGQPDGASKLCLGCHDGGGNSHTSHLFGGSNPMNLTESHPISFVYDAAMSTNGQLHVAGTLKNPDAPGTGLYGRTITQDLLDSQKKMQCTSCHDIHSSNTTANTAIKNGVADWGGTTLRFTYTADNGLSMCRTCHNK